MRKYDNFKFRVIKKMRARALTYRDESNTPEQYKAWEEVVDWFDSFFKPENRYLSKSGCICLEIKDKEVNKIDMIGVK